MEESKNTFCKYIALAGKLAVVKMGVACKAIGKCLDDLYSLITEVDQEGENPASQPTVGIEKEKEPAGLPVIAIEEIKESAAVPAPSKALEENKGINTTGAMEKKKYTVKYRDPQAKNVKVAMDYNDWQVKHMSRRKDGNWHATFELPAGKYAYKFVVDGQWKKDPKNPNSQSDGFGGESSVLELK